MSLIRPVESRSIRNPNTRAAYARAVGDFFAWLDERGITPERVEPVIVAAYVEQIGQTKSAPTVKQALAAVRMLFDWLVVGQVLPMNSASSVRGPKHVVKRGKTPVLTADQARQLLDAIDTADIITWQLCNSLLHKPRPSNRSADRCQKLG